MPTPSGNLGDKWWNQGKPESEWTDKAPDETGVPAGQTPQPAPPSDASTVNFLKVLQGDINSQLGYTPKDRGEAQQLLQAMQNFVNTGGANIPSALRSKVDSYINALNNFNSSGQWQAPSAGSPSTAASGDVRSQFIDRLKSAYPTKAQDSNWLNQQADYFVAKSKSGERMGNGEVAPLSYWLNRASGMGAGGADVAEAGDYSPSGNLYGQTSGIGGGGYGAGGEGGLSLAQLLTGRPQIAPSLAQATSTGYTPTSYAPTTVAGTGAATIGARPELSNLGGGVENLQAAPTLERTSQFQYQPYQLPKEFAYTQPQPEFTAPTAESITQDPGYQARLQQGRQTREQSKAAQGTLRGGATLKALQDYGQQMASQEYQNAYARALQEYQNRVAAQQTGYQQAIGTYGLNTQTGMQGQAQQYGQALSSAQLNAQNTLQQNQQALGLYQTQLNAQLANQQMQNQALQLRQQLIQRGYSEDTANAMANQQMQNQMAQFNAGMVNQAGQFGATAANQAGQFGAGAANQAAQFNAAASNQANQFYNNLIQQGYTQDVAAAMTQQQINNQMSQYQQTYGLQSANQGFQNQYQIANLQLQALGQYANSPWLQGIANQYANQGQAGAAGTVGQANPWISYMSGLGNQATSLAALYSLTHP